MYSHIESFDTWLWLGLMIILALGAFWFIWNRWHRARLIDDVPTARVRSAHQGYVELHGRGEYASEMSARSPLTGTECLWYRFRIERAQRDHKGRTSWRKIHSGVSEIPFFVIDNTGRALIDPRGAEVTCARKRVWTGSTEWPQKTANASDGVRIFGLRMGIERRYRYTEELLMEKHPLYALGWFRTLSAGDTPNQQLVGQLLRQWKGDQATLLQRFDANGDGSIDEQEWETARQAALGQVLHEQAARARQPPTHTLGKPRDDRRPFLLSDHPPGDLAKRYRLQAAASVAVFIGSSLGFLWLMTQRL